MFILLNGSFGIGKTTAASRLAQELPQAAISDPEVVGFVLRRLPAWLLGMAEQPVDYQDIDLWRRLIVLQARWTHRRAANVIIPMAFTNTAYLEAFASALEAHAPVQRLCLVAPLELVRERLLARAAGEGRDQLSAFEIKRSAECVAAHRDPVFGMPVDAIAGPDVVVAQILSLLER